MYNAMRSDAASAMRNLLSHIANVYQHRPWCCRTPHRCLLCCSHVLLVTIHPVLLASIPRRRPQHVAEAMNEDRAQELRQILAGSGSVTFIKSGQALSLRGDLVKNREYVRELSKLQV